MHNLFNILKMHSYFLKQFRGKSIDFYDTLVYKNCYNERKYDICIFHVVFILIECQRETGVLSFVSLSLYLGEGLC